MLKQNTTMKVKQKINVSQNVNLNVLFSLPIKLNKV